MKSIYLRNFAATAIMVALSFLLVSVAFVGVGRSYVLSDYRLKMADSAGEVARTAAAVAESDSLSSWLLGMCLSSISNSTGNHIFLTDESGVVLSCSDRAPYCSHIGLKLSETAMSPILSGALFLSPTDLDGFYPAERLVVASPILSGESIIGYAFVTADSSAVLSEWDTLMTVTALIAIAVFIMALIVSLIYSKRMARPLDEMAAASRKFARGDFSVRVRHHEDPSDEMGVLIDSFNKMADYLETTEARRSEFIANISHELRTPMTTISGFADGILDGTIPKEDEEKYLISIRDETKRLSRLVRDMLDVSRMRQNAADPQRRTTFDLTELVLQTLLSFESRAVKKDLDVDPQLPDSHLMVVADKDAITQVIYNLLDNAVKFAAAGSCLTLRLWKDNGKAYFSIKDHGETISPEDLPFIFDRFHKSDRSRSLDKDGVGLGLYLVKAILNSHDEDIAVRSEAGVTEFVFTLPLAEQK